MEVLKMQQKFFSKVALLVSFLALTIVSCTKKEEASSGGDTIKIGHFAALTGEVANFGQSTKKGVDLAMEQFNAAGGLNGKKVQVITYDDQSKPEEVSSVVTKLITQDNVLALLGEVSSGLSLIAADKAKQFGVPMLSSASTNPTVTEKGEWISRICFIDPFQGDVMANFAADKMKAKTAVIIRDL
ncbi:MAG: hypothetical protein B7Z55_16910, partial [Planctomycetales bacterium 12-60-4]